MYICKCCAPERTFNSQKALNGHMGGVSLRMRPKTKSNAENIYDLSPNFCPTCNTKIPFKKKYNKYCNHSCAAKQSNSINVEKYYCVVCDEQIPKGGKFCSHKCRSALAAKTADARFEQGLISDRVLIKKVLVRKFGYKCSECDLDEWRGHRLSLEVDHTDGDATNNSPTNLRLLCPNCHSVTPTWKGRNAGSGRKSRNSKLN